MLDDYELHERDHGLLKIAQAIIDLGNGGADTSMGAIEAHGTTIIKAAELIKDGLHSVAIAIVALANAVKEKND